MRNFYRVVIGVTLIEIMLVLVIVSAIVVTAIKYYKIASNSNQATVALQALQAIGLSADNYSLQNVSAEPGYTNITTDSFPSQLLNTPWGGTLEVVRNGNTSARTLTISYSAVSKDLCQSLKQSTANSNWSVYNDCSALDPPGKLYLIYYN